MLSTLILPLLPLALAMPPPIPTDKFPLRESLGFRLAVNLTNPASTFPHPINGLYVVPFRAGANINHVSLSTNGSVFFTTTANITRLSTDYLPTGLHMRHVESDPEHLNYLGLNSGNAGTPGFGVTKWPHTCASLGGPTPGTFVVCDTGFEAPNRPRLAIEYVEGVANAEYGKYYEEESNVPENCAAVKLLPECAELGGTKKGEGEEIVVSRCYRDVKEITWEEGMLICL
ncbi:hypothetical protein OQA88_2132 [Cercophora sp. LCS_1]